MRRPTILFARLLRTITLAALCFPLAHAQENPTTENRNLNVAPATKRVALVIGNAAYKSSPLINPVNDARAMASRLRSLGFDVVLRENLKQREIGGVYREFRSKITPGGVALVFYAGHGVQFKGQNYFPATDADISSEEDVPLQSLNLGNLLDNMEEAKAGVNLVFLDACRDNPFARRFRSASRGLAKVEAASGTLIHYATRPGSVASDGEGRNGTYTEALLAQMSEPGVPVELMLKRVANNVVAKTQGKQEPWVEGSLRGDFYFRSVTGATSSAAPAASIDLTAVEISFWESIKTSTDAEDFQAYLDKYPNGQFVALAERRVKKKPAKADEPTVVPGSVIKDCVDCPEMVILPTGIAMGKTEVTQGQWKAVMGGNPSHFSTCGSDCPVESVTWNDAENFIQQLNAKTGRQYRLPSEAEWESACRAGGTHKYCGSDNIDSGAWYDINSGITTHRVAEKQPNAWGLYDMSGNVWEWTQNCWEEGCGRRVLRGGSWNSRPGNVQFNDRGRMASADKDNNVGFRLAKTLDQGSTTKPNSVKSEAATDGQEWAESDNGSNINWAEAKSYCANKGNGWRLPTVAELQSSYLSGHSTPCGAWTCKVSSNSSLTNPWFWSNEPNGSSQAWGVHLANGDRVASYADDRRSSRALCVRRF